MDPAGFTDSHLRKGVAMGAIAEAIEAGDRTRAVEIFEKEAAAGTTLWDIHQSLFPVVQEVLNPPFINPHLPKMYAICREFFPMIGSDEAAPLVGLEISEYARRPRLEKLPRGNIERRNVAFEEIEAALTGEDRGETARLMASFWNWNGGDEFTRRMLLLGSGYLDTSLGHSISCTAFILLEAMERKDQDPWPVFAQLADYFHKGRFSTTPPLDPEPVPEEETERQLLRGASGRGIVNLHHPITLYAIERTRHLFSPGEYNHLVRSWIAFMGDKQVDSPPEYDSHSVAEDYVSFYADFSVRNLPATLESLCAMAATGEGRSRLAGYLVKGVSDMYQGNYNPHFLTGLGSALWAIERYHGNSRLVRTVLYQYVDYFFTDLKE